MERNAVYLIDILEAARLLLSFIGELDETSFKADTKTQYAVERCFEIMGEAVKRLSNEFKEAHSSIDWKSIAGMRDVMIHQYRHINLARLWDASQLSIPNLIAYIEPLIPPRTDEPKTESEKPQ